MQNYCPCMLYLGSILLHCQSCIYVCECEHVHCNFFMSKIALMIKSRRKGDCKMGRAGQGHGHTDMLVYIDFMFNNITSLVWDVHCITTWILWDIKAIDMEKWKVYMQEHIQTRRVYFMAGMHYCEGSELLNYVVFI